MYSCETCGARLRTRQGLGGHIRFRHPEVDAPANHRPHRPTAIETEMAERLDRLERSVNWIFYMVLDIVRNTPGHDAEMVRNSKVILLAYGPPTLKRTPEGE